MGVLVFRGKLESFAYHFKFMRLIPEHDLASDTLNVKMRYITTLIETRVVRRDEVRQAKSNR